MIQIILADDHAIVRSGLKQILAGTQDMTVVAEASDAEDLLRKVRKVAFDLVLLDISMPGRSGLQALHDLKRIRPDLPILILSMHTEKEIALEALRKGASGYITKESAPEELILAIRKVMKGEIYLSASIKKRGIPSPDVEGIRPQHTLSPQEIHLLRHMARGDNLTEIARKMNLSPKTISNYRSHLLKKMKMRSNAELISYALKNGLID